MTNTHINCISLVFMILFFFVHTSEGYSLVPSSEIYIQLKNDTSSQILTQGTVLWQRVFNYAYDFEKNILSGRDMYSHSNMYVTVPRSIFSNALIASMQTHTQLTAIIMSRRVLSVELQNRFQNNDCDVPAATLPAGYPSYLSYLYPSNAGKCYPDAYYNTTILYNAYITDITFDMIQSVSCQDFMTGFPGSCEFMILSMKFSKMIAYGPATGGNMEANPIYTLVSGVEKDAPPKCMFLMILFVIFFILVS